MDKVKGLPAMFDMVSGLTLAFLSCSLFIAGHTLLGFVSMAVAAIYIGSRIFKGETE